MAEKRLGLLNQQLAGNFIFPKNTGLEHYRSRGVKVNSALLQEHLYGAYIPQYKQLCGVMLSSDLFNKTLDVELPRKELRAKTIERLYQLYKAAGPTVEQDRKDPAYKIVFCTLAAAFDQAVGTVAIVHFGLYSDAIKYLGTDKHREAYDRAIAYKDVGCFCMTEIGHGTNVSALETEAHYEHATRSFVLRSPSASAAKFWIGGLAKNANKAVVFAQLIVDRVNHGVHVFQVTLRDFETHEPLPGITIGDCGAKIGLNGIDNGFVLFTEHRLHYDSLLDKHGVVTPQGKYRSPIKKKEKRFGAMLSALSLGRIGVISSSEVSFRKALTISIRYAATRRQFGEPEKQILDYELYRYRMMPHLAKSFAVTVVLKEVFKLYRAVQSKILANAECEEGAEYHALLSVFKVMSSWYSQDCLREARATCGGHGYSAYNLLGVLQNDQEVQSTWEGDNYVLIQQTSKFILKGVMQLLRGEKPASEYLSFISRMGNATNPLEEGDITDPDKCIKLMDNRLLVYLTTSMKQIRDISATVSDRTEAWNNSLVHFFHPLAQAFGEWVLSQRFLEFAHSCTATCAVTAGLMKDLAHLYMLSTIEHDAKSVIVFVSDPQMREIESEIRRLCNVIGESSVNLIEAVALPDKILGTPIASSEGDGMSQFLALIEKDPECYAKSHYFPLIQKLRASVNLS